MKAAIILFVALYVFHVLEAKEASPKVQVYSHNPGMYGEKNVLICHVSGFHPPEIKIDLLKGGQVIPGASQTDLAFEENWHYHLTKNVEFTPKAGERYTCRVTHMGKTQSYEWEADM